MVKLVLFDIGGVMIDFLQDYYIRYLLGKRMVPYARLSDVLEALVGKIEKGDISKDYLERELAEYLSLPKSEIKYGKSFGFLSKPNRGVIALINRLHKRYKVALLSNISRSRYIEFRKLYFGMVEVDRVFASAYLRMRKPEEKIYKYALHEMGTEAHDAVFVDNMIENVRAAKKAGLNAVHYVGYRKLVTDLRALDVNTG